MVYSRHLHVCHAAFLRHFFESLPTFLSRVRISFFAMMFLDREDLLHGGKRRVEVGVSAMTKRGGANLCGAGAALGLTNRVVSIYASDCEGVTEPEQQQQQQHHDIHLSIW